jgi:hypothetical protein
MGPFKIIDSKRPSSPPLLLLLLLLLACRTSGKEHKEIPTTASSIPTF